MAALRPLLGSLRRGKLPRSGCIGLWLRPDLSFLCHREEPEGTPKGDLLPLGRHLGLWWALPPPGAKNRGNTKVPETLGNPAKTLILIKSCRSVPPTPGTPRADREGRFTGTRPEARFLHHRATPSSRLVRVDGSRKLTQTRRTATSSWKLWMFY